LEKADGVSKEADEEFEANEDLVDVEENLEENVFEHDISPHFVERIISLLK
jgi:hypothetical protein